MYYIINDDLLYPKMLTPGARDKNDSSNEYLFNRIKSIDN